MATHQQHREREARRRREASLAGRDVGAIPEIANVRRRSRCRRSLRLFCETYNADAFSLTWSADHLRVIARLEEAATHGALYAFAMPRGSGKTTLCRMAALWAISYALCRYVFVVGANAGKAEDTLAALRTYVRFLPDYADDFPEISHPAKSLGGIANRASGQLCQGLPTLIEWGKDRIVLPTVPPPANWPRSWPLRDDGLVPTAGSVVSASGLTGDGIRGSLLTLSTGESIRPDLVLLDDPQTNESAHSPSQNATREQLVSADVLGMAGPGRTISAVMPCTVIAPGDMVDQLLDRGKHPLWRGERTKLLRAMPKNLDKWDAYFEVYRACALKEPPDFAEANAHYDAHRAALDEGADAAWPERKLPWERSAVQHAMHLYCRDPRAFWAEYQNEPRTERVEEAELRPDDVAARVNRHARGVAPAGTTRLTAFADVQKELIYWLVCAWEEDFTGAVVDYGTYPDQKRQYFTLRDAHPTLQSEHPAGGLEAQLFAGLDAVADRVLGREWPLDGGSALRVDRLVIDANWGQSTGVVYRFCRQSPHAALLTPSHGKYIGASGNPISDWPRRPGERRGENWILPAPKAGRVRHLIYDVNWWKSFAAARLLVPPGGRGALSLFGDRPGAHRLFSEHVCAEYAVRTSGRNRELDEWKMRAEHRDNHWLDCLVGCCVAASVQGCAVRDGSGEAKPGRRRYSFAEAQRRVQGGR